MATTVVLTDTGKAMVADRLVHGAAGTYANCPKYIGVGTGAGTALATCTALYSETTDEARTTGTAINEVTTYAANDTFQVSGRVTIASAGKTLTNAGLFDDATKGAPDNLFMMASFDAITLGVGEYIDFTWKLVAKQS